MPFHSKDILPREEMIQLIRMAVMAPSEHNAQPWKFSIHGNEVRIFGDFSRRLRVVDPDDHALYIGLGCALENFLVAARHNGLVAEVDYFPSGEPEECLLVHLDRHKGSKESDLFQAIPLRQSTRCPFGEKDIPRGDLRQLEAANCFEEIHFRLFTEPREILEVMEFVKEANRVQFSDPGFVEELLSWTRFNTKEINTHQDGLAAPALGLSCAPRWLGKIIMKTLATSDKKARLAEKLIRTSSELMLFTAEKNDKHHWINLGRSFERIALKATTLNIKMAHMNMPCEVPQVRQELQKYLGMGDEQPLLLLRIGYGPTMPRSPRRPVQSFLFE